MVLNANFLAPAERLVLRGKAGLSGLCSSLRDFSGDAFNGPGTGSGGSELLFLAGTCSTERLSPACFLECLSLPGLGIDLAKHGTKPEKALSLFFSTDDLDQEGTDISGVLCTKAKILRMLSA